MVMSTRLMSSSISHPDARRRRHRHQDDEVEADLHRLAELLAEQRDAQLPEQPAAQRQHEEVLTQADEQRLRAPNDAYEGAEAALNGGRQHHEEERQAGGVELSVEHLGRANRM
jgi:hypothetical protein